MRDRRPRPTSRLGGRNNGDERDIEDDEDSAGILGSLWCATLVILLVWLLVITIVFGLLMWDLNDRMGDLENDFSGALDDLKDKIAENAECCENITDVVDGFRPCLDELCDSENFPRILDAVICKGCWDANTNTPVLVSSVCEVGDLYTVCVAGNTLLQGHNDWEVGDFIKCLEVSPGVVQWIKNDGTPEAPANTTISDSGPGQSLLVDDVGPNFVFFKIEEGNGVFFDTSSGTSIEIAQDTIGADSALATGSSGITWINTTLQGQDSGGAGNFQFVPDLTQNAACSTNYIRKQQAVFQHTRCLFTASGGTIDMFNPFASANAPYYAQFEQCITNSAFHNALNASTTSPSPSGVAHMRCGSAGVHPDLDIFEPCGEFTSVNVVGPCLEFRGRIPNDCIDNNTPDPCALEIVVAYEAEVPLSSFVCC